MTAHAASNSPGAWPYRLSLATWIASIPLVLFGGTVTTLHAGMAENGWLNPDGHFLWAYPVDKRFANIGVFFEHHHREFGSLVGMLAIAAAIAAWKLELRPLARRLPAFALLAVCVQGLIGGLRVLENSPDLAFLHGVLAQAVFTLLAATALYLSPRWRSAVPSACKTAARLQRTTAIGVGLVFTQVFIGAWFRHSRADIALALHVILAVGVLGAVVSMTRQMDSAVEQGVRGGSDRSVLIGVKRRLHSLVGIQVLLGAVAYFYVSEASGAAQAQVSMGEAIFATAHVAIGALLLAETAAAAMWARRVVCTQAVPAALGMEGAR